MLYALLFQISENFLPREHLSIFTEKIAELIQLVKAQPESAMNLVLPLSLPVQAESTTKVPTPPQSQASETSSTQGPTVSDQQPENASQSTTPSQQTTPGVATAPGVVSGSGTSPAVGVGPVSSGRSTVAEETPVTSPVIARKMSTAGLPQGQIIQQPIRSQSEQRQVLSHLIPR
jgi:hypothetical protein